MNDLVYAVCEDGVCGEEEFADAGSALMEATRVKQARPESVVTVLLTDPGDLTSSDAGAAADALEMFAGIDEGENTDYDELLRLVGRLREYAKARDVAEATR